MKQPLSLAEASFQTGLSGTSRLHDLSIGIVGMTPGEFKNGGKGFQIRYSFADTPFGKVIIASTHKEISHIAFLQNEKSGVIDLQELFPHADNCKKEI
ncbi:MAG TPA: hypothetical protein VNE41_10475 [Chitinophagaceae bacterium]|nr:hypothetical protein [Chitinophagaceae bacterium]